MIYFTLILLQTSKRTAKKEMPALLGEDEVLGENDWLEDDLKKCVVKRQKFDCNGFLSSGGMRKRNRSGSVSPGDKADGRDKPVQVRSSQKKRIRVDSSDSEISNVEMVDGSEILNIVEDFSESETGNDRVDVLFNDMFDDVDVKLTPEENCTRLTPKENVGGLLGPGVIKPGCCHVSKKRSQKQPRITDFGPMENPRIDLTAENNVADTNIRQTQRTVLSSQTSSVPGPNALESVGQSSKIRIKVKVEDTLLMIPVVDPECSKTFSWLAEEVASRYYQMKGVRLRLSLGKDGAYFAPKDLVRLMLEDNDSVSLVNMKSGLLNYK